MQSKQVLANMEETGYSLLKNMDQELDSEKYTLTLIYLMTSQFILELKNSAIYAIYAQVSAP